MMIFQTAVCPKAMKRRYLEMGLGLAIGFVLTSGIDWVLGKTDWQGKLIGWTILFSVYLNQVYFRLREARLNPDYLIVDEWNLIYFNKGRKYLVIPLSTIEAIKSGKDGVGLILKSDRRQRILTLYDKGNVARISREGKRRKCDLFFMNFSPSAKIGIERAMERVV